MSESELGVDSLRALPILAVVHPSARPRDVAQGVQVRLHQELLHALRPRDLIQASHPSPHASHAIHTRHGAPLLTAAARSRALDYFYTEPCKSGVPLPPTVNNLPCNITCGPGEFLPLGAPACAKCDPGTYSIGGGYKFSNWEVFPEGMKTFCRFQLDADTTQECSGWILNGTYVYSGDMRGKRLMDSVLQYQGEWQSAGSVEFEYKVDAERKWDGLFFQIDGVKVLITTHLAFSPSRLGNPAVPPNIIPCTPATPPAIMVMQDRVFGSSHVR